MHLREILGTHPKKGRIRGRGAIVYGTATEEVEIVENGFKFLVNIPKGQKTGFFLDQRQTETVSSDS